MTLWKGLDEMKIYIIRQAINWDEDYISGVYTSEKKAMQMARKSQIINGEWGNCIIELELDAYPIKQDEQ